MPQPLTFGGEGGVLGRVGRDGVDVGHQRLEFLAATGCLGAAFLGFGHRPLCGTQVAAQRGQPLVEPDGLGPGEAIEDPQLGGRRGEDRPQPVTAARSGFRSI